MAADISGPRRADRGKQVFLHVGSPKTGTTFLQEVLWSQRDRALAQGLLLPLNSFFDHFLATVDVRELAHQERFPDRAAGIWSRVVDAGLRWNGNVLVSHELFAAATAEQAARAVEAWGETDVHIIVTARDLARQIPAEWQEHLKHRSTLTFHDFVEGLISRSRDGEWFWTVQDYADVCRRWSSAVPAANIHIVTVPGRSAGPELLWNRFAGLIGLDAEAFDLETSRTNTSLRAEQAELLRRVNRELDGHLDQPGNYPAIVKEMFAQQVLAGRPGRAIALSAEGSAFATERSKQLVDELEHLGVDVVGDLAELLPQDQPPAADHDATERPETTSETVLLGESVAALAGVLDRFGKDREAARRRRQSHQDRGEGGLAQLRAINERLGLRPPRRRGRALLIGLSERHPWLMRMRVRYWHATERVRQRRQGS